MMDLAASWWDFRWSALINRVQWLIVLIRTVHAGLTHAHMYMDVYVRVDTNTDVRRLSPMPRNNWGSTGGARKNFGGPGPRWTPLVTPLRKRHDL
jgi:hypothetical protein